MEKISITNREEKKVSALIKRYFVVYESNDRKAIDDLLSDDIRFSSQDPEIDKATYFKKCWPFSEKANLPKWMKRVAPKLVIRLKN